MGQVQRGSMEVKEVEKLLWRRLRTPEEVTALPKRCGEMWG